MLAVEDHSNIKIGQTTINNLGDDEFIYRFRLSKNCVDYLLTLLSGKLETATDR